MTDRPAMKKLIDDFGGIRPMARALGLKSANSVQHWKRVGYASFNHHRKIVDVGERQGIAITRKQLLNMYEGN